MDNPCPGPGSDKRKSASSGADEPELKRFRVGGGDGEDPDGKDLAPCGGPDGGGLRDGAVRDEGSLSEAGESAAEEEDMNDGSDSGGSGDEMSVESHPDDAKGAVSADGDAGDGNISNAGGKERAESASSDDFSVASGGGADVDAFEGEIRAHLAAGKTMHQAVQYIFDLDDSDSDSGVDAAAAPGAVASRGRAAAARMKALAVPILATVDGDAVTAKCTRSVARLCAMMYRAADEDMQDVMAKMPRPRLELGLKGLEDVAGILDKAQNIVVLSGAGVSVSCGIPDFRSAGGIYETVLQRYGLTDPQAIFDLNEFRIDPTLFYSFAKDIMPSENIQPSPTHFFIAELERRGKLLRNYSQNIDGLEDRAGISAERVVLCHGSFLTATCLLKTCRKRVLGSSIANDVKSGKVPMCPSCDERAEAKGNRDDSGDDDDDSDNEWSSVLKPDIVFFGESLPAAVSENLAKDTAVADLVLVLGTSMQVAPFARIPQQFSDSVPLMLVNRELLSCSFDVELLGNCDSVVADLCKKLQWTDAVGSSAEKVGGSIEPLSNHAAGKQEGTGCVEVVGGAGSARDSGCVFRPPRTFLFQGAVGGGQNGVIEGEGDGESGSAPLSGTDLEKSGADHVGEASGSCIVDNSAGIPAQALLQDGLLGLGNGGNGGAIHPGLSSVIPIDKVSSPARPDFKGDGLSLPSIGALPDGFEYFLEGGSLLPDVGDSNGTKDGGAN